MARSRTITLVLLAALAVAGCGGAPRHVTKQECAAQYKTWQIGPARPVAKSMAGYLTDLDFKGAVPDAQRLEAIPMPACADPAGYWQQLLRRVVAIGNNSDAGLGYIIGQAQEMQKIETKLGTELKRTTGMSVFN